MGKAKYVLSVLIIQLFFSASLCAQTRAMLPRFPDVVIEKGLAQNFAVSSCEASALINGGEAETSLRFKLTNVSEANQLAALKFRVLYPISSNGVKILINKKETPYIRSNPRCSINLAAGEAAEVELRARVSINYSKNAVREALQRASAEKKQKRSSGKKFLDEFSNFFAQEKFGKRFMVGNLVSKWGIFPVDFKDIKIKVTAPREFVIVAQNEELWHKSTGQKTTYTSSALSGFAGAVFVPQAEKEDFIKTQKILSSEKFMY